MTGDKIFISVKDFDEKVWQRLNKQQDKEVQGKEEVDQRQFQPWQDQTMEESNPGVRVEKEFLHQSHIDTDQRLWPYMRSESTRNLQSC